MSIKELTKKCCSCWSDCSLLADLGMLIFRVSVSTMMMTHGFGKLMSYSQRASSFPDPLEVGSSLSMAFVVFAEFFCPLAIILGIGVRIFSIPTAITMTVAAFVIHAGDAFGDRELALVYLSCFIYLFFAGGGRFSLDRLIWSKCKTAKN